MNSILRTSSRRYHYDSGRWIRRLWFGLWRIGQDYAAYDGLFTRGTALRYLLGEVAYCAHRGELMPAGKCSACAKMAGPVRLGYVIESSLGHVLSRHASAADAGATLSRMSERRRRDVVVIDPNGAVCTSEALEAARWSKAG